MRKETLKKIDLLILKLKWKKKKSSSYKEKLNLISRIDQLKLLEKY